MDSIITGCGNNQLRLCTHTRQPTLHYRKRKSSPQAFIIQSTCSRDLTLITVYHHFSDGFDDGMCIHSSTSNSWQSTFCFVLGNLHAHSHPLSRGLPLLPLFFFSCFLLHFFDLSVGQQLLIILVNECSTDYSIDSSSNRITDTFAWHHRYWDQLCNSYHCNVTAQTHGLTSWRTMTTNARLVIQLHLIKEYCGKVHLFSEFYSKRFSLYLDTDLDWAPQISFFKSCSFMQPSVWNTQGVSTFIIYIMDFFTEWLLLSYSVLFILFCHPAVVL